MQQVDSKWAIEMVTQLMAIPGKSCEERLIADAVIDVLLGAGIKESAISFDSCHKRTPLPGEIGNLIVKIPGARGRERLMLSAHLDTVPICVGCVPKRKGNRIVSANRDTGLGADDRAGVAAVLMAALTSLRSMADSERPPMTLCFFVQEEIGLQGSRNMTVSKLGKPAMALNFDGGDPYKMTIGATGGERMKITLRGIPAHAGLAPEEGASALHAAGLAIASLHKHKWLGAVKKGRRVGTSNIGVVQGGAATNVVADFAEVTAETRSHDSEFREQIADAIEQAFHKAAEQIVSTTGKSVQATVERRVDYDSFRLDEDSDPVRRVANAIEQIGGSPKHTITNGGVDANWLVKHGIPTVTVGCGQRNVHTKNEMLHIPDYLAACNIGLNFIQNST